MLAACGSRLVGRRLMDVLRYRRSHSLVFSDEVRKALDNRQPVVALESTIITHGMPYPANLDTARQVEDIVRAERATPATIALIEGRIHVGLNEADLEQLASGQSPAMKVSRRDMAYAIAQRRTGGTTVSGTMLIAARAGIEIFATGGTGGVHRGAESTMDISADLIELSRTNVAVVSAGIKSILDIKKSLEFLETHGTPVITLDELAKQDQLGNVPFPAFFTRNSGVRSPLAVNSVADVAEILKIQSDLGIENGSLISVPVPAEYEASGELIEQAIIKALREADAANITGHSITPFILKRVVELTDGQSLRANMALIKNNAKYAARIAVELKLKRSSDKSPTRRTTHSSQVLGKSKQSHPRPVVVGGSIVDILIRTVSRDIKLNGATYNASTSLSLGGVGRNLADGLGKLGHEVLFLSAIGDDANGRIVLNANENISKQAIKVIKNEPTASCFIILDGTGDNKFIAGDFAAHKHITVEHVNSFTNEIKSTPMCVLDANVPLDTMARTAELCRNNAIPLWYEPTDLSIAHKVLSIGVDNLNAITYSSPNLVELQSMVAFVDSDTKLAKSNLTNVNGLPLNQVLQLCEQLGAVYLRHFPNTILLVTLSAHGLALVTKNRSGNVCVDHFKPPTVRESIISVSGAGDCLTAAVISGLLRGYTLPNAIDFGSKAAEISLLSADTVPDELRSLAINS